VGSTPTSRTKIEVYMKSTEEFKTLAEARAFVKGVNYVDDIDVETEGPEKKKGKFVVTVIIGDEDEDET
jgi:hypothetical protein